ncbi:hypothetical protein [Adlercreutzia rubneri]
MTKQINFLDEPSTYRFALKGDDDTAFEISKDTLIFNSNDFYRLFFKGLKEKPEYELVTPDIEPKGQAKHVFDTVAAILEKACDSIDADWFKNVDAPPAESCKDEEKLGPEIEEK